MKLSVILLLLFSTQLYATTYTVSVLDDAGVGTLRQAIIDANSNSGTDNIEFSVAGTISLSSELPDITDPVTIDGTTAPGYSCGSALVIAIDGGGGAGNALEFLSGASGSSVTALNIRNFGTNAIQCTGATSITIKGCYIGTDLSGSSASGSTIGIRLESGSNNAVIGGTGNCDGNVISGNEIGISINGSTGASIKGNIIGLDATGSSAIANTSGGILTASNSDNTVIGGTTSSERNIISGNGSGSTGNGIDLNSAPNSTIQGNYVGLNAAGTAGIGNAENGIAVISSSGVTIGGENAGNVIGGHNFHAIVLNSSSNNCTIKGNKTGTNAAGTALIRNEDSGIIIINSTGCTIGGSTSGEGNMFCGSNSEHGIFLISADNNTIQGNYIGTDMTGTIDLGNKVNGIYLFAGTNNVTIGGSGAGEGNTIAYNDGDGILFGSSADNEVLISRNSIYCNDGKGINLNNAGNANLTSPTISASSHIGCSGTSSADQTIEIYYAGTCGGTCQGKTFVASVTANISGNWSYTGTLLGGEKITAIAKASGSNNTSEFTSCTSEILPVELLSFSGTSLRNANQLEWITASELNNDYFTVLKSQDGVSFYSIGRIDGAGNSLDEIRYTYLDETDLANTSYYKLDVQV